MDNATFTKPDLTTFCQLDDLGLIVTGQHLSPKRAVLLCRPVEPDDWCHDCGGHGTPRDSVTRDLAHVPFGWRPTTLQVRLRCYQCTGCGHVWRQNLSSAAQPRSCLSRGALRWALEALVVNHLSMTRIAAALDVAWNTVNTAVLAEGLIAGVRGQGGLFTAAGNWALTRDFAVSDTPMNKPQGRRFDTQAALDNAMDVFWRHGYEGTSIADLTRAIGITTSSLYAAFEGKRQLFDRVVERYLSTKGRFTSLALEEEKDSLVRRLLFEASKEYADKGGPGGCLIVSAATCVTDASRDVEQKLEAHSHSDIRRIETVLRADLEAERISGTADPAAVAGFVGTVLQGMAQRGRDGASVGELRSTAEMAFDQVERALQRL